MAGRKNQFNLSDKQIEAAAKTGREKTQKAYAEKADIIAKGYPTSSKKTGAIGSSNTGKKNQFSGKRTTGDGATRVDQVMAAAINSTLSAFQKLAADNTSSTGSLSMGESARAAINEAKTAKKEGRQVRPGQAQFKAEQDKIKSFNDGWAGDFKQKLLEGAQKSAESAYESERHAKEGLGKFGQGVVDFGIAGAQFAGDALLNAVAPGAGLAAMAGRAYGSASLDAQQRGLSEGEQQISGLKSAAIEMLTEKLFGSASKVAYGKGIIRNESLVNSLVNRLAKTDRGRTALKVLVGANEEGMEEVLSDILNPIADRILKLDDGKGDWSDLADDYDTQQMLEDYIIGGALGLVGAGTNVVSGQYRAENAQQRAYEEYQRQLVNAGLATEQGGDAQLTAEKYKNILDQSTQRGKRNLSDKETANLESLIRGTYAQEDASDVSTRLAQLGTDASEQTVNAIVKAVNGETLSRAEQKAFDANPYSQRVVNEMLDTEGVTSNEWYADRASAQSFTPEVSSGINIDQAQNVLDTSTANNPQFVNSMARQYEVAPEVVERTYNLNPTAPQAFETAFNAVYQMGQQGTDKAALGKVPVLSTAQANIAYQMGADSVMSTETTAPVTNNNTQEVNDNGVRIHNVAERINGQNTEGQIRGVETGTGENVAGGSQKEQGGISAAQIKAGEKVSYKGKQQKGVYYAAEDTEDMKKGRKLAESYGYKVTYFVGGNIRYAGGEFRGVVDTAKKTVMVRADHPDYTAEQIMRHEMGHAAFENGDLSIDEAREMLLDDFTADEINELIEIYNSEYGGILSAEEAFEEICCDALGRMNIFEGTDLNSESYGKAQDTVRKYAAERTGNKGRAPPQNGAKWSIEPINSYGGDVSPKSGSLKFSLQENDNITARTMKYYDKHHDDIEHISRAELEQANGIVDEMVDYMTPYLDRTNNKGLRFLPEEILGDTRFDNGSYGKTIENTTICFRTLAYIDFTNDIKEKIGRPLTVEESFLASQMLYDIAKEPQCLYCYVSLDRKAYDAFLLEYIKQRDAVITEYDALGEKEKEAYRKRKDKSNGKKDPLFKKFLGKRKATNNMRDRFNAWITLAENGDSLIGLSDLTTEEKRSQIKSEGGDMAEQMYDIEQYAQSASWAKKLEQYRSYNGEILRMSDDLVNTLNSEYGLRFYSFSEYTPAFIVENMQQIRDAALKGFKGLAYTKKPDFARIFAPTGMNINISVFARMDNGKIVPDTLQGADWGEVQELRSQYDNVGAVFVATTDEMVDWALEQDWIDVVIPFHIVRTGANVAEFYKWVNHTSQQADKKRNKNGRPGKKADITPPEHNNDFETYKRLVEKRNLIPRFEKWYGKDNYMKLVNETRRSASETPLLKPNFDENTLSEAIKSFDTFVEDGGYYGGWYEEGTDYGAAVDTVANDILSGKRANEVLYGRQDFDASEAMKHRKERQHGRKFSLEPVKPIQPKNGEWERGSTTDEVRAKHPDLWAVDAESSESRNPTQISGTVKSYRKIYDALKAEGFNGTVLDASSGLGYGTRAGIEEYGFNVEDIEPFPDSSYKPKYTDYSKLHKKYDVIISNAVLNVLPQDQRDALVVKMGQMLNDGGRMFINVRGTDVRNASSKVPIDEANMEYYISNTGSYQKGFTKKELVAYLSDALGKDYTVVGTNKFGAVSAVVTKQAEVSKKFSREPERLNELRRQNEELKQRVEYWRNQTKPTTTKTVRKGDVQKLAREVIDMSDTDLKPGDITESLSKLGEYILNEPELRYTDVAEMANSIASEVIENATAIVNEDDVEIHNELNDYLKRVKLRDDGSTEFASVRRNYKRRIMFDKNGLGVDVAYAELQNMFGEGYFPEDIINPGDMLERIAEVLDGTAPKYGNPNSYYSKEATEFLRNYIIDSMLGDQVRQTAPTYADKANAKLAETKADYNQRLRKQREEFNEKTTSIKEQNKQRVKEAISKERQRGEHRLQKFRDSVKERDTKRKETAEKSRYKKQIEKNVKTLSDWLLKPDHKNALKHIPGELQSTVRDFIASINFASARQLGGGAATQKDMRYLSNLERLHRYITDSNVGEDRYSGYLDLPPNFDVELGNFIHEVNALARKNSGYTINDMTVEQLKELSDIVKTMKKTITDMNRMYQNKTFQHAYDAGAADVETLKGYVKTKAFTSNLATNRLDQTVMWEQSRPAHVFKRFGKGGESIYHEFADGQGTMAFLTKEVIDFSAETYKSEEVKAWAKETHTFEFGGDKVTLTTAQLMSLYELNKRTQAKQHIDSGGFRVANFKNVHFNLKTDKNSHRFTDIELGEMFSKLTDRQKEVADKLQRFMVEKGGAWGNYVSIKRFDVEMFKDENYFPIKVDDGQLDAKETESVDNASLYQLLNMGFAKDVSAKANQALVVYDIFDVFANHMAEMAQYRSFALPVLDAMKWFNYKERNESGAVTASLREEMRRAFGSDVNGRGFAEKFITGVIKAYNGAEGRGDNSLNSKMLNRVNRSAVAYNTRVMIQQPSAIVRAAMFLNPSDLAASLKNYVGITTKANIEEMHKYSGLAVWKDLGFYDVNVSRGVQELIKHSQGAVSKINEFGMKGAELADKVTWAALWDASKRKVSRETGLNKNDAEFFPKVVELFEDTVYNTQVVDTVLTKSELTRNKSFGVRLFTSFMSEPMTTASLVTSEIFDIQMKQAAGQKLGLSDYKRLSKTCVVVTLAAIVNSALAALADAWRDDDDYGTFSEKWTRALQVKLADELMPLTYFPFVSNVWDITKILLDDADKKWFGVAVYGNGTDIPLTDIVSSAEKALEIFQEIDEKGDKARYTKFGGYYKIVNILSKITGVPFYNATREIVTLHNILLPSDKWRSYEPKPENAIQFAWRDGYLTDEEALEYLQDEEIMGSEVLDEGKAWFALNKWKTGDTSDYTKLYEELDKSGDIKGAVDELREHGKEDGNIKGRVTDHFKDAYINGSSEEREKIRRAMYATGLYGSVNEVIEKCNDWLKKTK